MRMMMGLGRRSQTGGTTMIFDLSGCPRATCWQIENIKESCVVDDLELSLLVMPKIV